MWEAGKLDCPHGHAPWRPDRCTASGCRPRVRMDNYLGMFDGEGDCRECGRPFDEDLQILCPECETPGRGRPLLEWVKDGGRSARDAGLRNADGEPCAHALLIYSAYQTLGKGEGGTISLGEIAHFFELWNVDDPTERQVIAGWFLELDAAIGFEHARHLAKIGEDVGRPN